MAVLIGGLLIGLGLLLHLPGIGSGSLDPVEPTGARVHAAEAHRRGAEAIVRDVELTAAPTTIELDGNAVSTWAFNGQVPGPEIRLNRRRGAEGAGDQRPARAPHDPLARDRDPKRHGRGTRPHAGGDPADPGTYFYHPHTGTQLDTGLYAPHIVEDPAEAGTYDRDIPVLLDDWIDGTRETPDKVFERLQGVGSGMEDMESDASEGMDSMDGMHAGAEQTPAGSDEGTMQEGQEEAVEAGGAEGRSTAIPAMSNTPSISSTDAHPRILPCSK